MTPTVEQIAKDVAAIRKLVEQSHPAASERPSSGITADAVQGEAMRSMLDPLEQAIQCAAQVMRDEREEGALMMHTMVGDVPLSDLYRRMSAHLDALLAIQIKRVTADETV